VEGLAQIESFRAGYVGQGAKKKSTTKTPTFAGTVSDSEHGAKKASAKRNKKKGPKRSSDAKTR